MPLVNLKAVAAELRSVVAIEATRLSALSEEAARKPRSPGKWSPKQVLGHLVDSALNNHQRIVRLRIADGLRLAGYDADLWVAVGDYPAYAWADLITLWSATNRLVAHVVEGIPDEAQGRTWLAEDAPPIELAALVIDYLRHLKHHLAQIPAEAT